MACHRHEFTWLKQKCTACGGTTDPEANKKIQEMYGCVGKAKKPHIFNLLDERIELDECPNKVMNEASEYIRAHSWASSNRLEYLYKPDNLPAKVAQAIDLIDHENNAMIAKEQEDAKNKK